MPTGGQITVKANLNEDSISVVVKDNGKGIPENIQKKIGQPFFTTKEKGTGLGLMVSQKIIQNHEGTLLLNSEVNKGTEVQIVL